MFGSFRPRRGRATFALWLPLLAAMTASVAFAQDSSSPAPSGPAARRLSAIYLARLLLRVHRRLPRVKMRLPLMAAWLPNLSSPHRLRP
jgi:hypothetical protein